jgi:hypothetical protein
MSQIKADWDPRHVGRGSHQSEPKYSRMQPELLAGLGAHGDLNACRIPYGKVTARMHKATTISMLR